MKKLIFIIPIIVILFFANCGGSDEKGIYKQGKFLYTQKCANCHQENGEGLRGIVPPLAKSDYLLGHRSELPCIVQRGLKGEIVVNGVTYGTQDMADLTELTEFEIANVLNYVGTAWGNTEKIWIVDDVRNELKKCE